MSLSSSASHMRVEVQPSSSVVRPTICKPFCHLNTQVKGMRNRRGNPKLILKRLSKEEIKKEQEKKKKSRRKRNGSPKRMRSRPSLTALVERGEKILSECRDEVGVIKDPKKKERVTNSLLLWCRDFRTELVLSGLAMTIRSGAKSTITAGLQRWPRTRLLGLSSPLTIDAHGSQRSNIGSKNRCCGC